MRNPLLFSIAAFLMTFAIGCGKEENTVVAAPENWQPTDPDDLSYMEDMNRSMDPTQGEQ